MTPSEASKLLDLPPNTSPEQVEVRYNELRLKFEDRIAKAPTPGLKAKYRESLEEITKAFETLTLAADSSALPVLRREQGEGSREKGGRGQTADDSLPRSSLGEGGRTEDGGSGERNAQATAKKKSGSREFVIVAAIAVVVLGAGGWWVMKTRAENVEKARIAAELQAETARRAEEARLAAEAEQARREKELLGLRTRMAELQVIFESIQEAERAAERQLTELRSRDRNRSAQSGQAADISQQVLSRQIEALDQYLVWLRATLPGHPASLARARATELVAAGVLETAQAGVLAYEEQLGKLKGEVEARAPDLPLIAQQVRGEPILAQWREILAEEQKKDREAASWLPEGATRFSADRELAIHILEKFSRNPAGIPADFPAALAWLEKLTIEGDFRTMLRLADVYTASERVPHDEDKMWQWRYRAAEAGDAETKYRVAVTPYDGYLPWNLTTRVKWLLQAAEAGHSEAQLELARYAGRAEMKPVLSGTIEEERKWAAEGSLGAAQRVWSYDNEGHVAISTEEGMQWLLKAVDAGNVEATMELGRRHAQGDGVEFDWAKAVELFRRHENDAASQTHLAEAYANGWAVEEDQTRAFAYFLKAAEATQWDNLILEVARRYAEGNGVGRDERQAIEWYSRAARNGNEEAADALRGRGLAPNGLTWPEAVKAWKAKAEDVWSMAGLGEAHEHGKGVSRDPKAAFEWYSKAAEKYSSEARMALARFYQDGIGVERDQGKAIEHLRRAGGPKAIAALKELGRAPDGKTWAEWIESRKAGYAEYPYMLVELGEAYEQGLGVPRDPAAAVEWYRKGAELGHSESMLALGRCYANGTGVSKDAAAAVEWYQRAARHWSAAAMLELGRCHASGTGVPRDMSEALRWTWWAASLGLAEAKIELRKLRAAPKAP